MLKRIIILCLLTWTVNNRLQAQFEKLGVGGRAVGMGSGYSADGTDSFSIYYNPAGIALLEDYEVSTEYGRYYPGLSDGSDIYSGFLAASYPFRRNKLKLFSLAAGYDVLSLRDMYRESQIYLSAAKAFGSIAVGASVKNLSVEYLPDGDIFAMNALDLSGVAVGYRDPVYRNGMSRSALSIDLGINFAVTDRVRLALSGVNISRPDLSLVSKDEIPPTYRAGVSYQSNNVSLLLDVVSRQNDTLLCSGAEFSILENMLVGRAGFNYGSRDMRNLSLGFGYRLRNISFDYSIGYPLSGIKDTYGIHRISISYGKVYAKKKYYSGDTVRIIEKFIEPPTPQKTDPERAKNLIENGRILFEYGEYQNALMKFDEALRSDSSNLYAISWADKTRKIVAVTPEEKSVDRETALFKKAMEYFVQENEVSRAYFIVRYLSDVSDRELFKNMSAMLQSDYSYLVRDDVPPAGIKMLEHKLNQALSHIYDRRYDLAVVECKDILGVEPNNILALTRLGSAYFGIDKRDEARALWKRVLELDPENTGVQEFLKSDAAPVLSGPGTKDVPQVIVDEYERSLKYYFQIRTELDNEGKVNFLKRIKSKFEKYSLDFTSIDDEILAIK